MFRFSHSLTNLKIIQNNNTSPDKHTTRKQKKPSPTRSHKASHSGPSHVHVPHLTVRTNPTTLSHHITSPHKHIMADRGRGGMGRGAQRGGSSSQRGGGRHGGPQGPQPTLDKPKREAILDLSKYVNARIRVKFTGGREVTGVLKGYDQLLNLVLDEVQEQVQDPEPRTRTLGLAVLRGPTITLLSPVDGLEEISNPFALQE